MFVKPAVLSDQARVKLGGRAVHSTAAEGAVVDVDVVQRQIVEVNVRIEASRFQRTIQHVAGLETVLSPAVSVPVDVDNMR